MIITRWPGTEKKYRIYMFLEMSKNIWARAKTRFRFKTSERFGFFQKYIWPKIDGICKLEKLESGKKQIEYVYIAVRLSDRLRVHY